MWGSVAFIRRRVIKKKKSEENQHIYTSVFTNAEVWTRKRRWGPPSPCPQVSASETPQTETKSVYMSAHPLAVLVESFGLTRGFCCSLNAAPMGGAELTFEQVTPNQMNSSKLCDHFVPTHFCLYSNASSHCEWVGVQTIRKQNNPRKPRNKSRWNFSIIIFGSQGNWLWMNRKKTKIHVMFLFLLKVTSHYVSIVRPKQITSTDRLFPVWGKNRKPEKNTIYKKGYFCLFCFPPSLL